ncbi:MAG: NADH-quinone oxidoreductase subunit J [Chloroflexi bacterium]|nr:NADH-quinone oxidoreductase subunit J [Chloroflexota bacterium]
MTLELIIFLALAVIAVAAAIAMLASSNAIYSALFLVLNFAVVSVFYLILNAPFIAMVQVTVYAGAIMVLFIFVIMLLGAERLRRPDSRLAWQQPLAIGLGLALLGVAVFGLLSRGGVAASPQPLNPEVALTFGSPREIGRQLFTGYLFPFEVTSILLLVAMVGAIVLTKDEKKRPTLKSQTSKK